MKKVEWKIEWQIVSFKYFKDYDLFLDGEEICRLIQSNDQTYWRLNIPNKSIYYSCMIKIDKEFYWKRYSSIDTAKAEVEKIMYKIIKLIAFK